MACHCTLNQCRYFLVLLVLVGCSAEVELGQVSGTVKQNGKPMPEVMVYFMPDPTNMTEGYSSWALTDPDGKYALQYQGKPPKPGAMLGLHRVVMEDTIPENFRGSGPPPMLRIPSEITNVVKTPLKFEVKAGEQVIDIDIPKLQPR